MKPTRKQLPPATATGKSEAAGATGVAEVGFGRWVKEEEGLQNSTGTV